jgi:hypothetical protein
MADTGVVTKQLEIAGYKDIQFEQFDAQVFIGKDLDEAIAFQLALGPAGEVYREAGKLGEERHDEIARAVKAELAKYQRSNGVKMDPVMKVTVTNPGELNIAISPKTRIGQRFPLPEATGSDPPWLLLGTFRPSSRDAIPSA